MVEGVLFGIGAMAFIAFFVADFFMAYMLYIFKRDHPQIDECAPVTPPPSSETVPIVTSGGQPESPSLSSWMPSTDMMHNVAIVASVAGPFFFFLQLMSPMGMSWSMFNVPEWLSFMTIVPALCLGSFYALRVVKIHHLHEVSKAQWLSLMWFRLDVIFVMASLMMAGWGDWLVALWLYALDFYLAHRLLTTERRLVGSTQGGHLLREEIDHRTEMRPSGGSVRAVSSTSTF